MVKKGHEVAWQTEQDEFNCDIRSFERNYNIQYEKARNFRERLAAMSDSKANQKKKEDIEIAAVQAEKQAAALRKHIEERRKDQEERKNESYTAQLRAALEREEQATEDPYLVGQEIDEEMLQDYNDMIAEKEEQQSNAPSHDSMDEDAVYRELQDELEIGNGIQTPENRDRQQQKLKCIYRDASRLSHEPVFEQRMKALERIAEDEGFDLS
jgi:hypothetical protein